MYLSQTKKKNLGNLIQKRKGQIKDNHIKEIKGKRKRSEKLLKILIQKCAQNFSWLMRGVSIDMCSIELQPKIKSKTE